MLVMNGGRERTIAEFPCSALRCRLHAPRGLFQRWLHRSVIEAIATDFEPTEDATVRFKHILKQLATTETEGIPTEVSMRRQSTSPALLRTRAAVISAEFSTRARQPLPAVTLTADREKAEHCFVSGMEGSLEREPGFKEWARFIAYTAQQRALARLNAMVQAQAGVLSYIECVTGC